MSKTHHAVIIFSMGLLFGCQKYTQQQEQNALVSMITSGTWKVTRYLDSGANITDTFSLFVFKFSSSGTVTGTKGANVYNGTWSGDLTSQTITSNFSDVGAPLNLLNHTWKITDSYPDSVAAQTQLGTFANYLSLRKQ